MTTFQTIQAHDREIRRVHALTRALKHPLRMKMLEVIQENRLTVTELYIRLRLDQSICSQHLAILRKAGIVKTERDGKLIYYSLNEARVRDILETFAKLN